MDSFGQGLAYANACAIASGCAALTTRDRCHRDGRQGGRRASDNRAAMKPPPPAAFEPEFIQMLREVFEEHIVFNRVIGLKISEIRPERVRGSIAMKPELIGHMLHQRLHGGVISTGLDSIGGLAVMAAMGTRHLDEPPAQRLMRFAKLGTIDLRIDYLRQAKGERFVLEAETLRVGSRVANARMSFATPEGTLLATGSAAYIVS